ncbi:MAG: aldo/keto reductase [Hungatella sp.]
MNYRKFGSTGLEISALGFGAMRFPLLEDGTIDEEKAIAMLRHGIDAGINYVDTAYPYHQGNSECVVGKALKDGYREKTYLATKCPVWLIEQEEDFDRILEEQLEKLDVDYVDFYLLHALDQERWDEKVMKFHLLDKMKAAKAAGKIHYIGFSFHDQYEVFQEIIDASPDWDFCQIQHNYINLDYQAGNRGLRYAAEHGLGVIIMEPLLGGKLANLAPHVAQAFEDEKSPVEHALDFLWDQPQVSFLLSGMGSEQQVEDNLLYAGRSAVGMVTPKEAKQYQKAKEIFDRMALVGCTGCAYCMPCPAGISIPEVFTAYNMTASHNQAKAKDVYDRLSVHADACKHCHRCEKECPQHITISELMSKITTIFE